MVNALQLNATVTMEDASKRHVFDKLGRPSIPNAVLKHVWPVIL